MIETKTVGRKPKYLEKTKDIHFPLEMSYVEKLEKLSSKYTNNNTTELLQRIIKRFIKSELG